MLIDGLGNIGNRVGKLGTAYAFGAIDMEWTPIRPANGRGNELLHGVTEFVENPVAIPTAMS